ncbi:MAG: enolase C-terminal domain-like protein [archaeon]
MFLKEVRARKIKDSRGDPTIEVEINGVKASSPSGKSKGVHETPSFHKSLEWNIKFLNKTRFNIQINSFEDLKKVESFIKKKTRLKDAKRFGANALFALECAILKALAKEKKVELFQLLNKQPTKFPIPLGNVVEGGLHAHKKNHPVFQEFLLIPQTNSPKKNFKLLQTAHSKLKSVLKSNKKTDEGAWEVSLNDEQVFEKLSKFKDLRIGTDIAGSAFHSHGNYLYKNRTLDKKTQIKYVNALIRNFNILYCEDPLQEEDFKGFSKIHRDSNHLVVGDDLTATQISRVKKAIKTKAMNAMIIKPNQNGSLIELAEIFKICKKHNIRTILSHRSGETLDSALADLAVGFGADYIKAGVATKWREAKLKRLVEIEKIVKN